MLVQKLGGPYVLRQNPDEDYHPYPDGEELMAKLEAAVVRLTRLIDEGGELPEGVFRDSWKCPVSVFLTEIVGRPVGVIPGAAWVKGDRKIKVRFPRHIREWIRDFDEKL